MRIGTRFVCYFFLIAIILAVPMFSACGSIDNTSEQSTSDISFDTYSEDMFIDAFETLPSFIDPQSSIIEISGSVDKESGIVLMSMRTISDIDSVACYDADKVIEYFPKRLNSIAYLYAMDAGDEKTAMSIKELQADEELLSGYTVYEDYRLMIHLCNEEGTLDFYGIREPGVEEQVLWQ